MPQALELTRNVRAKNMTRTIIVLLVLIVVWINWVTAEVVQANAFAGLYPAESDSIGIPIFGTWFLTASLVPFFLLVIWLLSSETPRRLAKKRFAYKAAIFVLVTLLHLLGATLSLAGTSIWADSHHWQIVASYLALLVWFVVSGTVTLRRVSSVKQ
jgi:hypothetical protein